MINRYNEKEYAEKLLENGFITKYKNHELKVLVKYYKYLGHTPKERKELLYEFCEKYIKNFNRVKYFKMINSVVNYSRKKENQLIIIEGINIYKSELDRIDSFQVSHSYKKVLFTMMVLNKLYNEIKKISDKHWIVKDYYFGGSESKFRELKELSKIESFLQRTKKKIHNVIFDLNEKGIIESRLRGQVKLNYMYDVPDSDIELVVKHFDDIGYYYDYYKGENRIKLCECCGIPIKVKSRQKKYCDKCSSEKQKEWQRLSMNKSRNQNNVK